jgi:HD-like signal output (HDOD) protein
MDEGVLWEHSVGSAFAAQMLSKDLAPGIYNMSFTAGLLHDVGKVALDMQLRGDLRKRFIGLLNGSGQDIAEREVAGFTHAEIGEYLCNRWNLPEEIAEAIRFHHEPSAAEGGIAGVVAAADVLSNIVLKEGREVALSDMETAPRGTFVPGADRLARMMAELPAMIASSRELLGGTSEVVTAGASPEEK